MGSRCFLIGIVALGVVVRSAPSGASEIAVYSSGSTVGNAAYTTSPHAELSGAISEAFSLEAPTTLSSAMAGLWVYDGGSHTNWPATLNWAIGTTPRGVDVGTGSVTSITNSLWGSSGLWDIYDSKFALGSGVPVSAHTTYWLTLTDATATQPNWPQWDIQPGEKTSESLDSNGNPFYRMTFTLYAVPEPSTLAAIVGMGVIGIAGYVGYRRRRAKAVSKPSLEEYPPLFEDC